MKSAEFLRKHKSLECQVIISIKDEIKRISSNKIQRNSDILTKSALVRDVYVNYISEYVKHIATEIRGMECKGTDEVIFILADSIEDDSRLLRANYGI